MIPRAPAKVIGLALAATGAILLAIAVLGHVTALGNLEDQPRQPSHQFDPELAQSLRSWPALVEASHARIVADDDDQAVMIALHNLVAQRFQHGEAHHTVWSNWILAFAGPFNPALANMRNPDAMLRSATSLLCGQVSYVLLRLALEHGVKARHVGLYGHVVMEAWYDNSWHMFDPDLEVIPKDADGRVLSVSALESRPDLIRQYYRHPEAIIPMFASRQNNTFMSYPPGAWFEWKSNVLYWIERMAEIAKFAIPLVLIILGFVVVLLAARPNEEKGGPVS